jgi:hypothetical protein
VSATSDKVIRLDDRRQSAAKSDKRSSSSEPLIVAMGHLQLDVIVETVRVLRMLSDRKVLDVYNQTERRQDLARKSG